MNRTPNEEFRERLYDFLKGTLSPAMTKDDLDIMIHLLSIVIGDRDYDMHRLQFYTSIDYTPTDILRQLGSNVAFPWSSALTPGQQRQYIKLYHLIRQRRSTGWSIENLCRVFGQDTDSYYNSVDLSSVRLLEYPCNYNPANIPKDGLDNDLPFCYPEEGAPSYPGDMVLRIPAISTILYNEIMNTKLAGTRLRFLFYFLMGPFHMWPNVNALRVTNFFFIPCYGKDDLRIMDWKSRLPSGEETRILRYIEDYNVGHHVVNYNVNGSMVIKGVSTIPYDTGWILHEKGDDNYKGYWMTKEEFKNDEVWYN